MSSKNMSSRIHKMRRFKSSCACANYHPGLCSAFIHSVVSNDYVSGQWRPWSDCAKAQSDLGLRCPHTLKPTFTHGAAYLVYIKFFNYGLNMVSSSENAQKGLCILAVYSGSSFLDYIINEPASVAQLDAPSDWRPGGRGFNLRRGRKHSFVEIDHEIFSTVILSLPWFKKGRCQFLAKECAQYWLTA